MNLAPVVLFWARGLFRLKQGAFSGLCGAMPPAHTATFRPQQENTNRGPNWVAVAGLVISIITALGSAASAIYERATKDAAFADMGRRVSIIETAGTGSTQVQAQRLTTAENNIQHLTQDVVAIQTKMATHGERLASIDAKLDTLLERTKPERKTAAQGDK